MQEVIIPVIHSTMKRVDEKRKVDVTLIAHNLAIVSSRLKVVMLQNEAVGAEVKAREVRCAIYSNDEQVSNEVTLMMDSTDAEVMQNRLYEANLVLKQNVASGLMQLKVYDTEDALNPIIKEPVTNNTLIEQDF